MNDESDGETIVSPLASPRLDRSEQPPSPSSPEPCSIGSNSSMATCLRLALRAESASSSWA